MTTQSPDLEPHRPLITTILKKADLLAFYRSKDQRLSGFAVSRTTAAARPRAEDTRGER